jgi:hypothetical protein
MQPTLHDHADPAQAARIAFAQGIETFDDSKPVVIVDHPMRTVCRRLSFWLVRSRP